MDRRSAARKTLAERLSELRLAAGKPAYSSLARRSSWLPKSTIGDVLNGHSTPSLEFVLSFVDACQRHAAEAGLTLPSDIVDLAFWRSEWTGMERALRNASSSEDEPIFVPPAWTVPPRSRSFVGREALLARLRESLQAGHRTAVHALHGIGGVGKTALAVEYAYRFAPDYRLVWWINAERPDLIGEQVAGLALATGIAPARASTPNAVGAARSALAAEGGWLVILDNAPSADAIAEWVPQGHGHVLITARSPNWTGVAAGLAVDVFTRTEATAFLSEQAPAMSVIEAEEVAAAFGDLPLALAQAIGIMAETGMGPAELLATLTNAAEAILSAGRPVDCPRSLAAAIQLAVARLATEDPAAAQLANLCAVLAPEPIPVWLFVNGSTVLPEPLRVTAQDPMGLRRRLGKLARYGLVQANADTVVMHRLTQAVLRELQRDDRPRWREMVEAMLIAVQPDHPDIPASWPKWGQLMPHILAIDPAVTDSRDMMQVAYLAVGHLHRRGDSRTALAIAEHFHLQWGQRFGSDDRHALLAARVMTFALRGLGRYEEARVLDEDILVHFRKTHGEDHIDTLMAATDLATDLRRIGRVHEALALDEDTLGRRRRILGEDHPHTLASACNLAIAHHYLGQYEAARQLSEDVLSRKRKIVGVDHPSTLGAASNLAANLRAMGRAEEALAIDSETLRARRRVTGEDHPDTLTCVSDVAADLRALRRFEEAYALEEDLLARRRRVLGQDHPDTLESARNVAADLQAIAKQ